MEARIVQHDLHVLGVPDQHIVALAHPFIIIVVYDIPILIECRVEIHLWSFVFGAVKLDEDVFRRSGWTISTKMGGKFNANGVIRYCKDGVEQHIGHVTGIQSHRRVLSDVYRGLRSVWY